MRRVLVTGARDWHDLSAVVEQMRRLADTYGARNVLVIAGGCTGLDVMAEKCAKSVGIHMARIDALWDTYHRAAGPIRNGVMLSLEPDEVLAFHNDLDSSKGTANCVRQAEKKGIEVTRVTSK